MLRRIAMGCGALALLLYGQTQLKPEDEVLRGCISVGPSGALHCEHGTLDIVTAVIPRLRAANDFSGLNRFSGGVLLDSSGPRPKCQPELRGAFWFAKGDDSGRDGVQVCVRDGQNFEWENLTLTPESK